MAHAAYRQVWLVVLIACLAVAGFAQNQAPRPANATVSAVEALAAALVAAKTDEERATLLEAKKELQTTALVQALLSQGNRLRTQWTSSQAVATQALTIFQLAQRIAEQLGDKAGTATALSHLGDVYRNRGKQDLALERYRKSRALREDLGDKAGLASVLLLIGFSYSAQGNLALALEHYQKSLAIRESLNDKTAMAWAQHYVGEAYRLQRNYAPALEAYQKALTLREVLGDKAGIAATLLSIGINYSAQGNFALAEEHYQKSLAIRETLGDKAAIAVDQNNVGDAYRLQRNYDQALEAYQKALVLREALNDKTGVASALSNIGLVHSLQGNARLALEHYQKSLAVRETLDDKAAIAAARDRVAGSHLSQGDFDLALEHYQKNLALYEALNDKAGTAPTLLAIGDIYREQLKHGLAADALQRAAAIWESIGDKGLQATALIHLAFIPDMQSNFGLAFEYYRKALALKEAQGDRAGIIMALYYLAKAQHHSGNYELALESYQKVISFGNTAAERMYAARSLYGMGNIYTQQSKYDMAKEHYQKSLGLLELLGDRQGVKSEQANVFCYIGDLYRIANNSNYALALENFQKCLSLREALGEKWMAGEALRKIGDLHYAEKNYAEALRVGLRAAEIGQQNISPLGIVSPTTLVGRAYRSLNQPAQAQAAFDKAIAAAEAMRAGVVGDELESRHLFPISPYYEMVKLLVAQNQLAAAFTYAERAKARMLLDVLRSGRTNVVKAMTAQEQAQEQSLKSSLVSLNSQLIAETQRPQPTQARLAELKAKQQTARQSYEAFQLSLYLTHPELRVKRGEAPLLELEEAASLLPDTKTALLEYVVAGEQTFLFVLTKNSLSKQAAVEVKVYPLAIGREDLTTRTAQFRQQFAKRDPGFADAARAFYDLLLKPAAAQLQGKTALVIVPDGPLWELPFQTLQPAPNRYLIEDHAISYVPSLTVLREMVKARHKQPNRAATLLAFGNPTLGQQTITRAKTVLMDEKLEPLPEAERQVNTLATIYGARQSKVYIGAEAREERAKTEATGYRIVHLATHGVLNDVSPMYSHLLLAQTEGQGKEASETHEDGLLEAWELMKLDLNADLVVLSACETARGRVGAGEGVIGLTWALFVAGCPRTVVSQWKVESASTTELMVEFHRQLKARMQNPKSSFGAAQALQTAALKLLRGEQYRHPFYWAGFVVVGDGR